MNIKNMEIASSSEDLKSRYIKNLARAPSLSQPRRSFSPATQPPISLDTTGPETATTSSVKPATTTTQAIPAPTISFDRVAATISTAMPLPPSPQACEVPPPSPSVGITVAGCGGSKVSDYISEQQKTLNAGKGYSLIPHSEIEEPLIPPSFSKPEEKESKNKRGKPAGNKVSKKKKPDIFDSTSSDEAFVKDESSSDVSSVLTSSDEEPNIFNSKKEKNKFLSKIMNRSKKRITKYGACFLTPILIWKFFSSLI